MDENYFNEKQNKKKREITLIFIQPKEPQFYVIMKRWSNDLKKKKKFRL